MQQNRNQLLLVLLAGLLMIKFVLIPLMDWQDEELAALALTQQKLQRAEGLLAKKDELRKEQSRMQAKLAEALAGVPKVADIQQVRVESLQKMQRLLEPNGVTVSLFDIASVQPLDNTDVSAAVLNIELKGTLPQLALAHFELEQKFPNLVINQFRLSGGKIDRKKEITLIILAKYYFRADTTAKPAAKNATGKEQA